MAAKTVSRAIPAPTGGWNRRDPDGAMAETDAPVLTNWWPSTGGVNLRNGYTNHVTGITGQVESLLVYNGVSSSSMFGFATTAAYDVTSAGAVGAAVVTGLTNARWQEINVATTAGKYLMAVNGADKAVFYTGSAWARDGDGAPYDITGVGSEDCSQINLFKTRVWLVEDGTLTAWYGPAGTIGGAYTAFRLNGIAREGGTLVAMTSWTIDAGYGVDDMAVFLTSEGEVIVYRGTDPSSVATWSLVGVWKVGAPIGKRCFIKYGGDVLLICQDGVVPLAAYLQSSHGKPSVAISDKIQNAVDEAILAHGSSFGWQLIDYPPAKQIYLNVPVTVGTQEQFVMNAVTKAWANFTGWAANCFAVMGDDLYFGGNTVVGHAWNGLIDNTSDIQAFAVQAFNYFGNVAEQKQFTMMKPMLLTNGTPQVYANINVDFNTSDPTAPLSFSASSYGVWDVGLWDSALWGSDLVPQNNWQGATGIGTCGAPVLKCSANGLQVQWIATICVFQRGGII